MSSDKSSTVVQRIPFRDDELLVVIDERTGKEYVLPKPMSDMFGLDWPGQLRKLKKNQMFSKGMEFMSIPSAGGHQDMVLLERRLVHAWLFSISLKRVAPAYREKLLQYQEECAAVLDAYFSKGIAVNPRLTDTDKLRLASEIMGIYEHLAGIFRAPLHIALQEGVKYAEKAHGVDLRPLLLTSAAVEDIQDSDRMLEPTELARELGYRSAMALNKALETLGWQRKHAGVWEATEDGFPHCTRHAWINQGKSGYNLKWNVVAVTAHLKP